MINRLFGLFICHLVSAPAVLGICLGGAILLVSVAAISCFCYRGHQQHRNHKLRGGGGGGGGGSTPINGYRSGFDGQPMPFRKATAVKSPNSTSASAVSGHFLKKSPSPTTLKSPPGSCPFSKSMVASSPLSGIVAYCFHSTILRIDHLSFIRLKKW